MIISQGRQEFDGRSILMPPWMRAPLYLQCGSRCWLAHRPAATSRRQTIYEVVLSSIDKSHWPHLWKLKLTTMDEAGTAEQLCNILQEHDIHILTAESSVHTLNRYNSMSFIVSMEDYQHELDGGHEHHSAVGTRRLEFLELLLLSSMGSQIVFHRNGRPRFELAPIRFYSQLVADRLATDETMADPLRSGVIPLPERVCAAIMRCCDSKDIWYSGAVDTENRVIRVLFFPKGPSGVAYIQVSASELNTLVISTVLRHLKEAHANVIRFQVRRGLNEREAVADYGIADATKADTLGPGRMDLTFESTRPEIGADRLIEHIKSALHDDESLQVCNVHITDEAI